MSGPHATEPKQRHASQAPWLERAVVLGQLVLLAAFAATYTDELRARLSFWIPVAVFSIARWRHCRGETRALCVTAHSLAALSFTALPWQGAMLLALVPVWVLPRFGASWLWDRPRIARGRVPLAGTLATGLVTPVALLGWVVIVRPDLSDVAESLPEVGLPLLLLGAAGFALVNAALEEAIWRFVVQGALAGVIASTAWVIALQAASFGAQHYFGVPRGALGITMAAGWAVLLGVLRHRAGGLLAPTIAHVMADATIAAIILTMYRP